MGYGRSSKAGGFFLGFRNTGKRLLAVEYAQPLTETFKRIANLRGKSKTLRLALIFLENTS